MLQPTWADLEEFVSLPFFVTAHIDFIMQDDFHCAVELLIKKHKTAPVLVGGPDDVRSSAKQCNKWCTMSITMQNELPVHICAQRGCVCILDWLCEKQGASPTAALSVK